MDLLLSSLRAYKLEVLVIFLFIFVPLSAILIINFKNIEKFFFFSVNYLTSKNPTFENISLTKDVVIFKGSIYSNNIHFGDIYGLVFLFITIVKKEYRKYFSILPNGTIPLALYVICSSVSIINAPEATFERSIYAITMHVRQFLFFYCFANFFRIPGRLDYQLKSFFFIALYTFVIALQQRYAWGLMRVAGDFTHPNGMVFYLSPVLVIFTALFFNHAESNYSKAISISTILVILISCLMSMSRGLFVNLGIGLFVLIVLDFSSKFNLKKPLILFSFFCLLFFGSMKAWDSWYDRFTLGKNEAGSSHRVGYYLISYEIFKEYRWFGIGINQFGSNAYQEKILDRVLEHDFVKKDPLVYAFVNSYKQKVANGLKKGIEVEELIRGGTPESYYALHFAETGIVGIIGTLVSQLFFLISAFRSFVYFRRRNAFYYCLSIGLFSGLLGMFGQSVVEYILRQENPMYLQAYVYAMISGIAYTRRSKKFDRSSSSLFPEGDQPPEFSPAVNKEETCLPPLPNV